MPRIIPGTDVKPNTSYPNPALSLSEREMK
jgi:hypothetical protein